MLHFSYAAAVYFYYIILLYPKADKKQRIKAKKTEAILWEQPPSFISISILIAGSDTSRTSFVSLLEVP